MAPGIIISSVSDTYQGVTSGDHTRIDVVSSVSRQPVNHYSAQLLTLNFESKSIPSPSQLISPPSMERCSFEEMDNLIRSSHHSATPTIIDSSTTDHAIRNTTDKSHDIKFGSIQNQLQIVSDRLARVEQSRSTRELINTNSRPASSISVQIENSTTIWSERLQAQEEINRLKLELAIARSQINNNQSTSHLTQSFPLMSTQSSNNHSLIPPTHVLTDQLPRIYSRSSAFKPIQTLVSDNYIHSSQVRTPTNIITPNVIQSSPLPIPLLMPTSSSPSLHIPSLVSTPFTMNINNMLPNFKGSAEERPVQFLTEFELRAVMLVGNNDTLLLHTVQQTLSEGALIWFS